MVIHHQYEFPWDNLNQVAACVEYTIHWLCGVMAVIVLAAVEDEWSSDPPIPHMPAKMAVLNPVAEVGQYVEDVHSVAFTMPL